MFGSALRLSGLLQVLLQLIGFFGSVENGEGERVRREALFFTPERMRSCTEPRLTVYRRDAFAVNAAEWRFTQKAGETTSECINVLKSHP